MRLSLITAASILALASQAAIAQTATTNNASGTAATPAAPAAGASATMPATGAQAALPQIVRGSRLIGADIENANGDDIGEVNDLVVDPKTGQIRQVIVGVGGFLGIGEKDVALQWDQVRIQQELRQTSTGMGATTAPAPGAPGTAMPPAGTTTGTAGTAARPATEASTTRGGTAATTGTGATTGVRSTGDLRIVVNMTKEQLEQAPAFRFPDDRGAGATRAPAATGTAPAGSTAAPAAGTGR